MSVPIDDGESTEDAAARLAKVEPLAIGPSDTKEAKRAENLRNPLGVPKGVFRFRTHEEADEWWEFHRAKSRIAPPLP